jgi:uncharacterized protein (TIRG00374 family)
MKLPLRNVLNFVASLLVGAASISLVLYFVGWRETLDAMRALSVAGVLEVFGTVFLTVAAWVVGWRILLRAYGIRAPFKRVIGARLSCFAVSYLTPTLYFGGEPFGALLVADKDKTPATRVFATIIVERFLLGVSITLFMLVGGFYAAMSPAIPVGDKRIFIAGLAFIAAWIVIGLVNFAWNLKWVSRIIRWLGHVVPRWRERFTRAAAKVAETEDEVSYAFTRHWKATLLVFFIQVVTTVLTFLRPQVFFGASLGMRFTIGQLAILYSLYILLGFFLWITPGGLGTSEAGAIGIFRLIAPTITTSQSVAYSLTFKLAEAVFVAIGIWYLMQRGLSFLEHRAGAARHRAEGEPASSGNRGEPTGR